MSSAMSAQSVSESAYAGSTTLSSTPMPTPTSSSGISSSTSAKSTSGQLASSGCGLRRLRKTLMSEPAAMSA
eukprot:67506-Chlamydomonas_euryale.AAC.16